MARVSLRAACDQARQWLESNDLERAIGLCEHILRESPGNLEAYRILGEACLANRQLDRAQEAFERVLRSDPESIPAHVGLGITFERRGKLDRAVQEFEQALEIKPDMPELRSQLLRLYSDGGIENAQLRLSRAGLARLYAKGQMLPQAIAELRHVIGEQPNRYDAKVALAEILWRDEQEAAAASLCRKLVGERAELLKAQLLLGYIDLSAGRPSGEQHWRAAAAIDPDLAVARALFDPLPPIVIDPPQINAWDELAWQRQRDELEQIAATRPMQAVVPAPLPPEPQEFIPGASFFASRTAAPSFDPAGSDDFLASLLDLATPSAPAAKPAVAAAPVSVPNEDLGLDADMQPFSLSELGLTEDELAGLNPIVAPPVPPTRSTPADVRPAAVTPVANTATPPPVVRPALQVSPPAPDPVSDDDDLIAFSLNSLDEDAPTPAVSPSSPADEYDDLNDIGAFSLSAPSNSSTDEDDDLNDIDAFSFGALDDQPVPPPAPPTVSAPVQPTRTSQPIPEPDLDDLGLGDMQPFSLADLGLSDEEIAGLESIDTGIDTNRRASAPNQPIAPVDDYSDLPVDLLPFSMDALDQSSSRDSDLGGLPSSLQPFSIDEPSGMQRPRVSGLTPDLGSEAGDDDEENTRSQRGFSWQQPSTKPETNFASSIRQPESPTERTLFNKLKQMRETRPIQPADEPPEVTLSADEHLGLFSLDDVPLNDPTTPAASSLPQISGIARREGTSVFSSPVPQTPLPPLASKPQPPISAVPPTSSVPKPQPPVPVVVPPTPPVTDSSDNIHGTIAAGDLEPFSLEELGLSSEEIAALGLGEAAPPPIRTPEPEPTISEPAPTAQHEHVEINMDLDVQGALAAGEVQPFSFADLGLTDEELAALGLSEAPSAPVEPEPTVVEPGPMAQHEHAEINTDLDVQGALAAGEVQPFSFADLGLSDEEIAALGLGDAPNVPATPKPEPTVAEPTPMAQHEHVEIDTDLDVQGALASGEVQPFSFADLGLSDEEIAALGLGDAPNVAATPKPEPTVVEPGPMAQHEHVEINTDLDVQGALASGEVQPFSFADLGLSDEEIAALGLGEAADTHVPTPAPEAFTLDEDDSLTSLEPPQPFSLDLPVPPASSARLPEADMPSLDDDLRPFSLGEFGFADDESGLLELDLPDALSSEDDNLSLTAEELAGLDVGGDLNLKEGASPRNAEAETRSINTGDRAADRLITLGLRQGYVDISDIIAAVENPEEEAERIEAIGRLLHQQVIEIRDGDEIIDMDAEYAEEEAYESSADELIPEVGIGETASFHAFDIAPIPTDTEADMTPFSLNELGLSDEEIALLGLGEASPVTIPSPSPTPKPEEPDLVSFSLSELGLDDSSAPNSSDIDILPFSFGEPDEVAPLPPTPQPVPVVPPTPTASVPSPAPAAGASLTGNEMLDQYLQRVESDPENHSLRLSVARASARVDQTDLAIRQYKQLIRRSALLDDVVDDLTDLIAESDDQNLLRQLHRTLGDAYSKQGLLDRAMEIYAWTPGIPKAIRP